MKKLLGLLVVSALVSTLVGCGRPKYMSAGLYDLYGAIDSPIYERSTDSVTIRMSPQGMSQPRDIDIRNVQAPENARVSTEGPKWFHNRSQLQVIVQGVSVMNHTQPVTFDIFQNGVKRQTVTITISAPPEVNVKVDGQPVNVHEPV